MAIDVWRVSSAADLPGAFALRRDVFIGEGLIDDDSVRGPGDTLLFDLFDTIEETSVFVAVDAGRIVGSVRTTGWSVLGFPADASFDFRAHVPAGGETSVEASALCVVMGRRRSSVGPLLVQAVIDDAIERGSTHLIGCIRPHLVGVMEAVGGSQVGAQFDHLIEQVPVIPMVCEISDRVDRAGLRRPPVARRTATSGA